MNNNEIQCGEKKKGHVCTYQPMNFKCQNCKNLKKDCICGVPDTCDSGIQCELDVDLVVRNLDLNQQVTYSVILSCIYNNIED